MYVGIRVAFDDGVIFRVFGLSEVGELELVDGDCSVEEVFALD